VDTEGEVERSLSIGTPSWFPVQLSWTKTVRQARRDRGQEYVAGVAAAADIELEELNDLADSDPRLAELLIAAGDRVVTIVDPDYRDMVANLVGAAFADEAIVDEVALLTSELLGLEPAHLRVLLAVSSWEPEKWRRQAGIERNSGMPAVVVEASLQRLEGVGFVRSRGAEENASETKRKRDLPTSLYWDPMPPGTLAREWIITDWGKRALELCGRPDYT
jgi:hypothetical protein